MKSQKKEKGIGRAQLANPSKAMAQKFDPYAHLNLVLSNDGTCTRLLNVPTVQANPNPGNGELTASKDVVLNPSNNTTLRIFLPTNLPSYDNAVARLPIVLHFHASAWVLFGAHTAYNHASCSQMATQLTIIVVSVNYRVAPEHRLPAQYDDALEALLWLKRQAVDEQNGEPWLGNYADFSRCYLLGSSSGANIVFHTALRAMEYDLRPLRVDGYMFYQPLLGGKGRTPSELQHYSDPVWPLPALDALWELALPKGVDRDHRYCNPVADKANRDKVASLGRCLVVGYGGDVMFERQQEFVKMLVTCGVRVDARFDEAGFHSIDVVDPRRAAALLNMIREFIYG